MKIYCKGCFYLNLVRDCEHPTNIIMDKEWEWYEPAKKYKQTPQEINKNNNCEHFKEDTR